MQELLETMSDASADEQEDKARLLWDELIHLEERRGKSLFTGQYTWTHYGRYRTEFDAEFVRKLNEASWIRDSDDELQRPGFLLFEPLGWKPNPFLQSKIRFKPPVIDALAKEAGLEPGILNLLKKLGLTSEAELRSRLGIADSSETEADERDEKTDTGKDHISDEDGDVDDAIKDLLGDDTEPTPPAPDPSGPEPTKRRTGSGSEGRRSPGQDDSGSAGRRIDGRKRGRTGGKPQGTGGSGKQGAATTGDSGKPFISYVATRPNEEEPDPDGLQHQARMALEEKAIDLILQREPQLKRTPTNNPGYDLCEPDANDEPIRRVEVKAMTSDLQSRPVGLSRAQFECAREHRGRFWLYVVEHAADPKKSRIVRIQDPAGKARTFCFDHGCINVADIDTSEHANVSSEEGKNE